MSEKDITRVSKFMSLVLRHKPETIGLKLDENGWTPVTELIEKMNEAGFMIDSHLLEHVVETNNKKRFAFSDDKQLIRASQGHSIDIELNLSETEPPAYLYHGTGEKSVGSILATGLDKRNRQHVHLSSDKTTAVQVGSRHGPPRIFMVASGQMKKDGFSFYLSANSVWLTDHVPPQYLSLIP